MIYRIIVTLLILASVAMPILLVKGSTTNVADKELEDEEQMRYLKEWRKRKGK